MKFGSKGQFSSPVRGSVHCLGTALEASVYIATLPDMLTSVRQTLNTNMH